MKKLQRLGERHKSIWPDLLDAHHLATAGLLDEAGPIVRDAYTEFRKPSDIRDPERRAAIRALRIPKGDWEAASRVAGDHYFAAKHVWELETSVEADALGRLQYPIAFGRELWPQCQQWNLDPYLVLAIMRQESIYNPDALSHTGAIGLMQFIKGTGAKVSAMLKEPFFSPQTLFNPSTNLRYSAYYLRILNERFGGNFPVAVASYNGGPHHMSRVHKATLGDLKLDAFVEFIPRKEPRDYVKKVMGHYQRYVELYGPPGAKVVLPEKLTVDNKDIVNF
jgi:soluble lytic murein transglycosylase-like protein